MFTNTIATIIFVISIISLIIIFLSTIIKIIKSKNYYNCKKLIFLELSLLLTFIITVFLCIDISYISSKDVIFAYFFLMISLIQIVIIPSILFILISTILLTVVMKHKKYDSKQNIVSLKRNYQILIILNILTIITSITNTYVKINNMYTERMNNAIDYYENKYNISSQIIEQEEIIEDSNIIGPSSIAGILYLLDNGDKIYYNLFSNKYYDNKQNEDIQKFIYNYYQDVLDNIINELKLDNKLSRYHQDSDDIELYSHNINANDYYDYKYYSDKEFYFNNYYNLNDTEIIKELFSFKELYTKNTDIKIICDQSGEWENILDKYIRHFEGVDINIYLYDLEYKSNIYYNDDAFASYININGKIEKRK